jgi:hypothetical protein
MKANLFRVRLLAAVILVSLSVGAKAQEKMTPDAYTGVAMGTGGSVGGRSLSFDFRVTSYTTDQELESFAQLLKEKGADALERTLEKENKGRVNPVGTTGNPIVIARKRQQGDKTIINLLSTRWITFREAYNNGRSMDYPYTFIQVTLDAQGKGTGKIMGGAKVRFNKKSGKYELESFGGNYIKAMNVRPNK